MKVSRRQFLKILSVTIGTVVAAEVTSSGADTSAAQARASGAPIKTGKEVPSVCPYCSVGCGQIVTVNDSGKIIDIQGHPDSPINQGTLCPKGAATYKLVNNDLRWTKVKYRAPGHHWEEKPLDWAMDRIAELTRQTRDANFNEYQDMPDGKGGTVKKRVINTYAVASLGGVTMDSEWNYTQQKLMHAPGVVYLENRARIWHSSTVPELGELTFGTDETANVTMCTMNKNSRDIRVGEKVEVTYYGRDGKPFADAIDIATPVFVCYTEYE